MIGFRTDLRRNHTAFRIFWDGICTLPCTFQLRNGTRSLMKNYSEDDLVDMPRLTPAQEVAYNVLKHALKAGDLLLLTSHPGRGRTTVLRRLREDTGGGFVTSKEFLEASGARHPLSLEEALYAVVARALDEHDIDYVDDVDLIHDAT